jgi:hypothetical protein
MEHSKSVPAGLSVGQNEPPVSIGYRTQPSESTRDKNRGNNMALKRAGCADLGNGRGEVVRMW